MVKVQKFKVKSSEYTHKINHSSSFKEATVNHFSCRAYIRTLNFRHKTGMVQLQINYGNKRVVASTGIKCKQGDFNTKTFEIKDQPEQTALIRKYISEAESCFADMKLTKRPIDLHLIKAVALGLHIEGIPNIQECIKKFIEVDSQRVEIGEITKGVLRKNKVWNTQLAEFCGVQYGKFGNLSDVKPSDIKQFVSWLKSKKENTQNVTQMKAGYFKRMMNFAIENQWITVNPFLNYRKSLDKNKKEGLTISEFQSIADLKLIDPFINRVRECFLFLCMTGLSYKDATELKAIHIKNLGTNEPYIEKKRTKTGNAQIIYLRPECIALLDKYKDDEYCKLNGLLLPFPSNVHMNRNLKVIGHMTGIKKILTTHLGRHTLATILANKGASPLVLKEVLGHSDISMTTKHYLTVHAETVVKGMKEALETANAV